MVGPNCLCGGDGVPKDTDRGEVDVDDVRWGEGRLPDGDALYRGGVIVSVNVVAMGVMSKVSVTFAGCVPVLSRPSKSR